jgi:hypothetical protein
MKKKIFLFTLLLLALSVVSAQNKLEDFKVKNASNLKERTEMLNALRGNLNKEFKQEFSFSVQHFKVGGNYAWLMATAIRKDGKSIVLDDEIPYDCCHVEALFKKINGKWKIVESVPFSSDVWYVGIEKRYSAVRGIFK